MAWSSAAKRSEVWSGTWLKPPGATCEAAGCVNGGTTGLETFAAGGGTLLKFWVVAVWDEAGPGAGE